MENWPAKVARWKNGPLLLTALSLFLVRKNVREVFNDMKFSMT
jgi:hypothetical protein